MLSVSDIESAYKNLEKCTLCPRDCKTNRYTDDSGICTMGKEIKISSFGPHYGEEPEIVGSTGSGTIFFSGCSLLCLFCQNSEVSHYREGFYVSERELAEIMIRLEKAGCSNINLVTPTHFVPQIISSLFEAKEMGLSIPIVYNTSGYEKIETLKMLEGLVDIYMPDIKFFSPEKSNLYTNSYDYFEYASKAVLEMHRQVGDLVVRNDVARKGLLIRHLILPNNQSDTDKIIDFIAENIGSQTYLNLMEQYKPCYKAANFTLLNEMLSKVDYENQVNYAKSKGFKNPEYIYS
ncbi:MAG: radical SAM protein [Ignavibacteriae bacterium]|nr:radical SAM protein [Ignavibacteriota bacterium]